MDLSGSVQETQCLRVPLRPSSHLPRNHPGRLQLLSNIPWVGPFLQVIPSFEAERGVMKVLQERALKRRMEKRGDKDIFNHLLGEEE